MITLNRTFQIARRTLAFSAVLGIGVAVAHAQQGAAPAVTTTPTLNFQVPAASSDANFSSSAITNAVADEVADATSPFSALSSAGTQPPPRRGYSRPRYRGGNTNPDGSNKFGFLVGGGFTIPEGTDSNYLKTNWGFQVGGGRNFNKNFGVMAQFDWDTFGLTGSTLDTYSEIFAGDTAANSGIDGRSHIWSLTLNPTFNIFSGDGMGAYVVAGGGFYHKAANFFIQEPVTDCEFGFCEQFLADETIQKYSSNSPGVNGGFGLTYKTSHFSNSRLYAEVRVVHTFNNFRPESTINPDNSVTGWNFFPQNSRETTYFPIKVGLRF
jgi:Outer membrane protein beta-barrel domain